MKDNFWKELVKLVFLSLVIVVPFRLYIAQPFIVEGASMDPTFKTGEYLIVDELTYRFKEPKRGSILIFKYPRNPKKSFIKRVIGLPNETISISDGEITIINAGNPDGFVLDEPYIKLSKRGTFGSYGSYDSYGSYVLSSNEYFVLGDNRPVSSDSRIWGLVPEKNIIGRPIIRFFPPTLLPGDSLKFIDSVNNIPK